MVRKHPAPKGALRRVLLYVACCEKCQKAPSAKRCIKTSRPRSPATRPRSVRKHPAPKGALRPVGEGHVAFGEEAGQKAPSAKRCIKTHWSPFLREGVLVVSESTQRQKVH